MKELDDQLCPLCGREFNLGDWIRVEITKIGELATHKTLTKAGVTIGYVMNGLKLKVSKSKYVLHESESGQELRSDTELWKDITIMILPRII